MSRNTRVISLILILCLLCSASVNALAVGSAPLFAAAGFDDELYLAVIANTPRQAESIRCLAALCAEG